MSYKRISSNKYKIIIEIGFDIYGKRKRKTEVVYGSLVDVKKREAELTKKYYHSGSKINISDLTFNQYSKLFIEEYCLSNVSKVTVKSYAQLLSKISPLIGNIKLNKITTYTLDSMYKKLKDGENVKERKAETLLHYYRLINKMMVQAMKWKLIDNNPNQDTTKPKREKKERRCYDLEQVIKLLQVLDNEPIKYKALITLALDTGARRGEICGLKWSDIDFDNKTVLIDNSLKVVFGVVDEENPKNIYSKREIIVSDECINILKSYKEWQDQYKNKRKNVWIDENRVFTSNNGTHIHPDTCGDILKKIIKKYDLPEITFHELRHTNTSLLINSGANIKSVSKRLGHSNTSTTMNIYEHAFSSSKKENADIMNNILMKK